MPPNELLAKRKEEEGKSIEKRYNWQRIFTKTLYIVIFNFFKILIKLKLSYELDKQKKELLLIKLKEDIEKYNSFLDQYFTKIVS